VAESEEVIFLNVTVQEARLTLEATVHLLAALAVIHLEPEKFKVAIALNGNDVASFATGAFLASRDICVIIYTSVTVCLSL